MSDETDAMGYAMYPAQRAFFHRDDPFYGHAVAQCTTCGAALGPDARPMRPRVLEIELAAARGEIKELRDEVARVNRQWYASEVTHRERLTIMQARIDTLERALAVARSGV